MKWWTPLVTAAVVFGAVGALVVVAVITIGIWRRFNPLVPDGVDRDETAAEQVAAARLRSKVTR